MESSSNPPQRLRRLLATLAVGAACAAVVAVVLATLGRGGPEPARAGAPEPAPVAEGMHGGSVPGMSESELRDVETATLGAEHAREHALMREALREQTKAGALAEPERREIAAVAAAEAADVPADVGRWLAQKYEMPIVAIHAALLPTGKVMIFSYPTYPDRPNNAEAWLWDPANPTAPPVAKNPPGKANIWCAGQTFAANGELVVFGGNLDYESPSQTWKGLDQVFTFNPWNETWTTQPKMAHGRWYPTGVRMPDGRIPIVGGLDETGLLDPNSHTNFEVELFEPSTALGGVGLMKKIGDGEYWADNEPGQVPAKPPIRELYPRMISMASGETLLAGPDKDSTWAIQDVDTSPFTWDDIPNLNRHRAWGSAVPLPSGPEGPTKVMALGGTQFSKEPSSATTELYDETTGAGWQWQSNNVFGRGHANTVLLPDGSMVQVGGGRGSSAGENDAFPSPLHYAKPETRAIELWDPLSKQWTLGPAQTESRAYHSTALLLPDGRVMSAGDEWNGDPGDPDKADSVDTDPDEDTIELYEPPYLNRGVARPVIQTAPATVGFGGSFGVGTLDQNVKRAALVAPGAVTHGVDMNQRVLMLDVEQGDNCVSVTAPDDAEAAPPGFYMLFLLNDQGVPSIAKFVRVIQGGALGGCTVETQPPDTTAPVVDIESPTGGTVAGVVDVRAKATDARGVTSVRFQAQGLNVEDTTPSYATTWSTLALTNGVQYTITATARDAAGNVGTDTVTVTVQNSDVTPPAVSITSPAAGAHVSGTIPLTASASDAGGVASVRFVVDGPAIEPTPIGAPDTISPFSVQWPSIDVPNGDFTLTAIATDTAGNQRTSAGVPVTVFNEEGDPIDALPPKKPINRPGPPVGQKPDNPSGPGNPGGPGNLAPSVSRLKASPARVRKGKLTRISFRLSEPARVSVVFDRKLPGRRVRGRCAKPRKGLRANCTRYVRARTKLSVQGKAGANSIGFRGRGLAPGRYRLTLVAKDPSGRASRAARLNFRLLASRRSVAARAAVLSWF
jgi:hypothetical protein